MRNRLLIAVLVIAAGACTVLGRNSKDYKAFVASHDAMRPGMSMRQVFDASVADYLVAVGPKNVPGGTLPAKEPASPDCRRHVVDVHYGPGGVSSDGSFSITVSCNTNGPSDTQLVPRRVFPTKAELLDALETYAPWMKSMSFRVESPPLQIGGVYDSYVFSTDESGQIADVSPIVKSPG